MIHLLIKFEQDMVLDTLGVNKVNRLSLSNYSLKFQIFFINLLIALFGFIFFILFNIYLIQNDKNIISDYEYSKNNLLSVKNFLEKNSIVRVPLFDDTCKGLDTKNCLYFQRKSVKNENLRHFSYFCQKYLTMNITFRSNG